MYLLLYTFQKIKQETIKYGFVINQNKTKYMRHSRVQTNVKNKEIEIEGMKIEEVNSAKYLGTIMNVDKLIEEEIKERLWLAIDPSLQTKRYSKAN